MENVYPIYVSLMTSLCCPNPKTSWIEDELKAAAKPMGLVINEKKTKIMSNSNDQDYLVDELRIETVVDFKYLGQIISFSNR